MRLKGTALPLRQLSSTAISDFIACPESFRLKRLVKKREPMNSFKFIGIVDHQTHARNFRQKIVTKTDISSEEMMQAYADEWAEATAREGDPDWDSEGVDPVTTYTKGNTMTQLYHEKVSPRVQPIRVEERFELKIPEVPIPVVGYIDVEEEKQIRERKTAGTKLSKPKSKWRFQGRVYQLATSKPVMWDIITKQVTPQVVTAQEAPGLLMGVQNPDVTVRSIQQTYNALVHLFDRYGADQPWPTNGTFGDWACDYCSYKEADCVAWS